MLIGWSKHQASSDPLQPSTYMLDAVVEKDFAHGRGLEARTPVPELLIGHPIVFPSRAMCLLSPEMLRRDAHRACAKRARLMGLHEKMLLMRESALENGLELISGRSI